jgi:hypothetical protein
MVAMSPNSQAAQSTAAGTVKKIIGVCSSGDALLYDSTIGFRGRTLRFLREMFVYIKKLNGKIRRNTRTPLRGDKADPTDDTIHLNAISQKSAHHTYVLANDAYDVFSKSGYTTPHSANMHNLRQLLINFRTIVNTDVGSSHEDQPYCPAYFSKRVHEPALKLTAVAESPDDGLPAEVVDQTVQCIHELSKGGTTSNLREGEGLRLTPAPADAVDYLLVGVVAHTLDFSTRTSPDGTVWQWICGGAATSALDAFEAAGAYLQSIVLKAARA